jgi:hypothetical protein
LILSEKIVEVQSVESIEMLMMDDFDRFRRKADIGTDDIL